MNFLKVQVINSLLLMHICASILRVAKDNSIKSIVHKIVTQNRQTGFVFTHHFYKKCPIFLHKRNEIIRHVDKMGTLTHFVMGRTSLRKYYQNVARFYYGRRLNISLLNSNFVANDNICFIIAALTVDLLVETWRR